MAASRLRCSTRPGSPLTPPEGITFDGKLGLMQGIIVTPGGDVWALGVSKSQLLFFPQGRLQERADRLRRATTDEPCKSFLGPFPPRDRPAGPHLGDPMAFGGHVTRFPASDPTKAEKFKTGWSGSGLGIDSQGNVWVTNRLGSGVRGAVRDGRHDRQGLKTGGNCDEVLTRAMVRQDGGR